MFVACARRLLIVWHSQNMTYLDQPNEEHDQRIWAVLHSARDAYMAEASTSYDEVLTEVSQRAQLTQSIGKTDIGALLIWKRLRADTPWATKLMNTPDAEVRTATSKAYHAVNDLSVPVPQAAAAGRSELSVLSGFKSGDALASALLLAAAPNRLAIYDRRALSGLKSLGLSLSSSRGRYGRYMELVESLRSLARRQGEPWLARDVDLALYWLGGQKHQTLPVAA